MLFRSQEVAQILRKPEVMERFFATGMETVGSTPAALDAMVKADIAKWGRLINAAKIRIE